MADTSRLSAFQGARQRYVDQNVRPDNPELADQVSRLSDEQFALWLHNYEPKFRNMAIVPFLTNAGFDMQDVLNKYYRPNTDTEDDFSKYLGFKLHDPRSEDKNLMTLEKDNATAPNPNSPGPVEGVARSIAQMGTAENSDEIMARLRQIRASMGGQAEGMSDEELYQTFLRDERARASQFSFDEPGLDATGRFIGGLSGAAMLPTGAGMTLPGRAVAQGIGGGIYSGLYGIGENEGDLTDKLISGAANVVPGVGIGAMLAPIGQTANPTKVNLANREAAETLKGFGVNSLTAGMKTGDDLLRMTESRAGDVFDEALEKQRRDYMRALWRQSDIRVPALDEAGNPIMVYDKTLKRDVPKMVVPEDATQLTFVRAVNTVADEANAIEARNKVILPPITGDINKIYTDLLSDPASIGSVQKLKEATDIINAAAATKGELTGEQYRILHSALMDAASGAGNLRHSQALRETAKKLDDAMEDWIKNNNPTDLGAFKSVRKKWNGLYTLTDAVSNDSEALRTGFIKPEVLRDTIIKRDQSALTPRLSTSTPTPEQALNPYIRLANAAEEVGLGVKPNISESKLSMLKRHAVLPGLGSLYGTAAGAVVGGPAGAVVGAQIGAGAGMAADVAASALKSKVAMTPLAQKYLNLHPALRELDPVVSAYTNSLAPERADKFTDILGVEDTAQQYRNVMK